MQWELDELERWLVATLGAATGLEVFNSFRAGRKKTYPQIVFRMVPGIRNDVRVQGMESIMVRPTYDITVVTKGASTDASEAKVGLMQDALKLEPPAHAGNFLVSCARLNPLSYSSDGVTAEEFYEYRGGSYQFWLT